MDKKELLAIFDREMRMDLRLPGMTYEQTGRIVRDYSLTENTGFIDYSALDETCADAEIDAQTAYFQSRGMPFAWKVFDHDRPPDLRQRLAARGFTIEKPNALMILDLDNAPGFYWSMALPDDVKRIMDRAGVEDIVRLEEEVYQSPRGWLRKHLFHILDTSPDQISFYAVSIDDRIVSAAWISYYPATQFASLLGGATLPEFRKRGYYTALFVTRAREARQRGCRFLTVNASLMSAPILEKHGFQCLGFSTVCRWTPEQVLIVGEP